MYQTRPPPGANVARAAFTCSACFNDAWNPRSPSLPDRTPNARIPADSNAARESATGRRLRVGGRKTTAVLALIGRHQLPAKVPPRPVLGAQPRPAAHLVELPPSPMGTGRIDPIPPRRYAHCPTDSPTRARPVDRGGIGEQLADLFVVADRCVATQPATVFVPGDNQLVGHQSMRQRRIHQRLMIVDTPVSGLQQRHAPHATSKKRRMPGAGAPEPTDNGISRCRGGRLPARAAGASTKDCGVSRSK